MFELMGYKMVVQTDADSDSGRAKDGVVEEFDQSRIYKESISVWPYTCWTPR